MKFSCIALVSVCLAQRGSQSQDDQYLSAISVFLNNPSPTIDPSIIASALKEYPSMPTAMPTGINSNSDIVKQFTGFNQLNTTDPIKSNNKTMNGTSSHNSTLSSNSTDLASNSTRSANSTDSDDSSSNTTTVKKSSSSSKPKTNTTSTTDTSFALQSQHVFLPITAIAYLALAFL